MSEINKLNNFLSSIEEIVDEARNGRMYVLVDNEDRENEGDLIIPAQMATPDAINFMATYGRGLICLSMTKNRIEELELTPMEKRNTSKLDTAFTVSIESTKDVTTGISAADRAKTIQVAIDKSSGPSDISTPGHVFPLMARDGGVLVRAGHTEAAVDISRIAGLNSTAVICEIMKDDGTMARLKDLIPFCKKHNLKIGSISDLIRYRVNNDPIIKRKNNNVLNTKKYGEWNIYSYENTVNASGPEHLALVKGKLSESSPVLVRVHVSNFVNDAFDGVIGDKGNKNFISLDESMSEINKKGSGLIVVINYDDSSHALSKYIDGNDAWNEEDKIRENGIGAQIIRDQGVKEMVLLSKSKRELVGLEGFDIKVITQRNLKS
ncbi:3,4-dihydroxy-2-butanone-4-phosphate synthase [Alphaproteobacteria bacterium]|nr:3,4-dihydroxy-2-butanone-4-phosphate synthase [Alphaproteobacteria bacterium]